MNSVQFLMTQVTIGLSYDHFHQERASILQVLAERFSVRNVEEVPVSDPHERLLRFFTRDTIARSQQFLAFLEQQKRAGVLFAYELHETEGKGPLCCLFALVHRVTSQKIARWSKDAFHQSGTLSMQEACERNPMKLRVTTLANLTQAQREALQRLGCEATPYISWSHELVFAATCESWQEQELRRLVYVTRVEPMPTYGPA